MERLADRVDHAYQRMRNRDPTVAFCVIPRDSLVVVGTATVCNLPPKI
jgi:hypothetical protein